ncbi:MAG: cardiolipin synthase [Erysipelotrichaceae bacterium]|nr:cardiolipin synthase [Erysipelotrichaceae bacterium]MCI1325944.1 cardiolipin synthase [Solobacterium sp.]MCH4043770.1 cardiolipin synthase [Erysipelotrichaceae bacterium]MCH4120987.1 cardiolipin synthase [Erysipelotrichaceae bacterium]MCI1362710.1 cardiolipin synthase [Solobacterium sp.]
MMKYMEKLLRILLLLVGAVLELMLVMALFHFFTNFAWIDLILRLLSIVLVITIINNSLHLSFDMMWILIILLFPVPGTMLYFLLGANLISSQTTRSLVRTTAASQKYFQQDDNTIRSLEKELPSLAGDIHYLSKAAGFPVYHNTGYDYYPLGDDGYPVMLAEMRKAKKFIFLEYFIIERGVMWDGMMQILKEKAAKGLDVRVMYDDMGSLSTLPASYAKQLEKEGIHCVRFNKLNPIIGAVMNHRDHRKIMVIDGKTAFTGGINLADEYINHIEKHGHWKDNCIRVTGEAVWSFTVLFLTNWNALRPTDHDFSIWKADSSEGQRDGYIVPYGDSPFDDQNTGRDVYMNILNRAEKYVYISTPYLIIDSDLENALILAARRGVDVRILTPGVPDKKTVWYITRSFYRNLMAGGVRIYEYTPGFNHAKVFVSDDLMATVGTINLDYRSLYLHFENGTYLCGSKKISTIRDDLLHAFSVSHEIRKGDIRENILQRLTIGFIKLFAGQM